MSKMVKKTKKDEKGPPKDQFDPLLVESSQAATVVLLLDSPEEEILSKSTEAIYRFVQKCDANKKLLLHLGSIPQLLKLVQSENRGIHRNACMVLGTMSQLSEVGKVLKKFDETIPAMIRLLNPDEEALVHEYAAMCLSNMAKHFSGICQIREQNGLESLIRCLSSPDQDVKNNALEVVALMLEDYQTRAAIRELHGLPPILELLKSEYPDIQLKALIALQKITEEVPNRTALRELGAVAQLVDFVGTPLCSEFHVLAVNILSNFFEDAETVKVIKENGVLSRLVAIVTDAPPPPAPPKQDDKKSKKDKGVSRAGTKTKVIDEKSRSKSSLDDAAQIVPTLPEVKEKISLAVMHTAKNAEIRKLLQEHEVEKMLILFLGHPDAKVQIAASQAIMVMAENLLSRDCTGKWGGIPSLVKMTADGTDNVKEAAVMALNVLTTGNNFNCQEVARSGGAPFLLSLLSSSREVMLTNVLRTLVNLAKEDDLRQQILEIKLIPALVKTLFSQSCDVQAEAALAVAAFILSPEHRRQFIGVNGVQPLVMLLDSSSDKVRRNSTKAITVLATDTPTAEEVCRLGGLDILRHLQNSDTWRNAFTDEAIMKLLENNLSAKYALIGKLCAKDVIADGFYDMGRVRPGNRFLPLLEYHLQPVNGNRPVLVVYAPLEDTEKIGDILKEHTACDTKNLEVTHDKPKLDAAADEEINSCISQPRVPRLQLCIDSHLVEYINTIQNILEPFSFCSIKERAVLLARFVAEKMGGPVEKGKLVSFSWELLLSQLKFQLKSNVIPLGLVTKGIHYHRALLFKVLGDRVGIPSSLVSSEYNHAWNELYIEENPMDHPKYPPKLYIIDLIYEPGLLMRADSPEAAIYMKP